MRKHIPVILVVLLSVLLLHAGCSNDDQSNSTDWVQIIRADFLSGKSIIEEAIAEVVSVDVKQEESQITVTVTAPDICDELLNWLDYVTDDEFTETAMEEEILRLLKDSEKIETEYLLSCSGEGETAEISYTSEFGEAMTCGLTRFYAEMTQRVLDEMGGDVG